MAAQPKHIYTPEEYLAIERAGSEKHEYYQGEIFALAGCSPAHNQILSNIIAFLKPQLRRRPSGPCRIYPSDQRIKVPATGSYSYPDASVFCGPLLFDDARRDTLLNPSIIIEILSPSTEAFDRG